MSETNTFLKNAIAYVEGLYKDFEGKSLLYHNWDHINTALNAADDIVKNTPNLSDNDKLNIKIALVFHDVGYFQGSEDHELRSAETAEKYLTRSGMSASDIEEVKSLIMATNMHFEATTIAEKVVKDSDFKHFSDKDYLTTTFNALLQEINSFRDVPLSKKEWAEMSIDFMESHHFQTEYCQTNYEPQKQTNLKLLRNLLQDPTIMQEEKKNKKDKVSKVKIDKPDKGVETMFRVALRNHMALSTIADNKANTLISVNGIIISIVISALFPKMDSNPHLIYPGAILISFSILTIFCAILSTIPKATNGLVSKAQVEKKEGNLIFFGNFFKMSLSDYEWSIDQLMHDKEYLYKSLTRDLYFLGKVLNKKYTLLRYSYYLFTIGLFLAIVFFFFSINTFER